MHNAGCAGNKYLKNYFKYNQIYFWTIFGYICLKPIFVENNAQFT